jgi:hypothetical protein
VCDWSSRIVSVGYTTTNTQYAFEMGLSSHHIRKAEAYFKLSSHPVLHAYCHYCIVSCEECSMMHISLLSPLPQLPLPTTECYCTSPLLSHLGSPHYHIHIPPKAHFQRPSLTPSSSADQFPLPLTTSTYRVWSHFLFPLSPSSADSGWHGTCFLVPFPSLNLAFIPRKLLDNGREYRCKCFVFLWFGLGKIGVKGFE